MKKLLIFLLSSILCLGISVCLLQTQTSVVKAQSKGEDVFVMQEGARFRTHWYEPNCGIVFTAEMDSEFADGKNVTLFLTQYKYLDVIRESTGDSLTATNGTVFSGFDLARERISEGDYLGAFIATGLPFSTVSPVAVDDGEKTYYMGGIKNVKDGNLNNKWFAIYYYNDGVKNVYAEIINGEINQARSMAYISSGVYQTADNENIEQMTAYYMNKSLKSAISKVDTEKEVDVETISYLPDNKNVEIISSSVKGTYFDDYLELEQITLSLPNGNTLEVGNYLDFKADYSNFGDYVNQNGRVGVLVNVLDVGETTQLSKIGLDQTSCNLKIGEYQISKATLSCEDVNFVNLLTGGQTLTDNYDQETFVIDHDIIMKIPSQGRVLKEKNIVVDSDWGANLQYTPTDDGTTGDTTVNVNVSGKMFDGNKSVSFNALKNKYDISVTYTYDSLNGKTARKTITETKYYGEEYNIKSPYIAGYNQSLGVVSGCLGAENLTQNVVYTVKNFTVKIENSTGGEVKVNGNSSNFSAPYGTQLTLTNVCDNGFGLAYYTKNGTNISFQDTFILTGDVTFGGVFKNQNTAYFRNAEDNASIGGSFVSDSTPDKEIFLYLATSDNAEGYIYDDSFYFEVDLLVNRYKTSENEVMYNKLGLWFADNKGAGENGMFIGVDLPSTIPLGEDKLFVSCPVFHNSWKWNALYLPEKENVESKNALNIKNYNASSDDATPIKLGVYKSGGTYSLFVNGKYIFSETNPFSAGNNYVSVRGWGVEYTVLSANWYPTLPYKIGSAKLTDYKVNVSYGKTSVISGKFGNDTLILSAKRQGTNPFDSTVNSGTLFENYEDNYSPIAGYIDTNYFSVTKNGIIIKEGLANQWYGTQTVTLEFSDGTKRNVIIASDNYFSSNFDETYLYANFKVGVAYNRFVAQDTEMDSVEVDPNRMSTSLKYTPSLATNNVSTNTSGKDNGVLTIANNNLCSWEWWKSSYPSDVNQTDILKFPTSGTIIISFDYSAYNSAEYHFEWMDKTAKHIEVSLNDGYNSSTNYYTGSVYLEIDVSDFMACYFRIPHEHIKADSYLFIDNFVIAPKNVNYLTVDHAEVNYGEEQITLEGYFEGVSALSLRRQGSGDWDTTVSVRADMNGNPSYDATTGEVSTQYITLSSEGLTIKSGLINQLYGTEQFYLTLSNGQEISFSLTSNMVWYSNFDETITVHGTCVNGIPSFDKVGNSYSFTQDGYMLNVVTDGNHGNVVKYEPKNATLGHSIDPKLDDNGVMTFRFNNNCDYNWWDFDYQANQIFVTFDYKVVGEGNFNFATLDTSNNKTALTTFERDGAWHTYQVVLNAADLQGFYIYAPFENDKSENSGYMYLDNIGVGEVKFIADEVINVTYGQDSVTIPYSFGKSMQIATVQKFGESLWDTTYTNEEKQTYDHTNFDINSGYIDPSYAHANQSGIVLDRYILNQCYGTSLFKITFEDGTSVWFKIKSNQIYFTNFKETNILEELAPRSDGNIASTQDAAMRSITFDEFGNLSLCYTPRNAVLKHSKEEGENAALTFQKTGATSMIWCEQGFGDNFYITFDYLLNNSEGEYRLEILKKIEDEEIVEKYYLTANDFVTNFYYEFNDSSIYAFKICSNSMADGCMFIDNFGIGNL